MCQGAAKYLVFRVEGADEQRRRRLHQRRWDRFFLDIRRQVSGMSPFLKDDYMLIAHVCIVGRELQGETHWPGPLINGTPRISAVAFALFISCPTLGQLWREHERLSILHNNCQVRLLGWEARRVWQGHRWHADSAKNRERTYGSQQQAKAGRQNRW